MLHALVVGEIAIRQAQGRPVTLSRGRDLRRRGVLANDRTTARRHLLYSNYIRLKISSFGFTKPSESKDPSRWLVYLLRSPNGQFFSINFDGVF